MNISSVLYSHVLFFFNLVEAQKKLKNTMES